MRGRRINSLRGHTEWEASTGLINGDSQETQLSEAQKRTKVRDKCALALVTAEGEDHGCFPPREGKSSEEKREATPGGTDMTWGGEGKRKPAKEANKEQEKEACWGPREKRISRKQKNKCSNK